LTWSFGNNHIEWKRIFSKVGIELEEASEAYDILSKADSLDELATRVRELIREQVEFLRSHPDMIPEDTTTEDNSEEVGSLNISEVISINEGISSLI
jgi:hypothetical protein